jgi:hypothetical protein
LAAESRASEAPSLPTRFLEPPGFTWGSLATADGVRLRWGHLPAEEPRAECVMVGGFFEQSAISYQVTQRRTRMNVWKMAGSAGVSAVRSTSPSTTSFFRSSPSSARLWKPYYRFEHIDVDANDAVFAGVPNLDGSTLGVRFDISTYAAIKTEGRFRRRIADQPRNNGWFLQIAFTF